MQNAWTVSDTVAARAIRERVRAVCRRHGQKDCDGWLEVGSSNLRGSRYEFGGCPDHTDSFHDAENRQQRLEESTRAGEHASPILGLEATKGKKERKMKQRLTMIFNDAICTSVSLQ